MALRDQIVFPTANTERPLEGVPLAMSKFGKKMDHVVVLSTALGGQNSAVVLKRTS